MCAKQGKNSVYLLKCTKISFFKVLTIHELNINMVE